MFVPNFFTRSERLSPVQLLILLQLRKQSMYGYEILKTLREQFGDIWEPKTGTIYPALRRLETRRFIQTELKEEKEFYSLTEKGKEMLKDAGGLLEGDLEFAEKYYRCLPPPHRGRIMRKMMERMSQGRWPLFVPFHPNNFEDKKTQIMTLKMMREAAQKWLQALEERVRELENEASGESRDEGL